MEDVGDVGDVEEQLVVSVGGWVVDVVIEIVIGEDGEDGGEGGDVWRS